MEQLSEHIAIKLKRFCRVLLKRHSFSTSKKL